jgi:POT family proton-dependent oligopeptide transporter
MTAFVDKQHGPPRINSYGSEKGSSIVENSEGVTEHELATLRHVADRLPFTAWLVVFVEFAERYVPI